MKKNNPTPGCLLLIIIIFLQLSLGAWSVDYLMLKIFHTNLPIWMDFVIGFFTAEITVPIAILILLFSLIF